MDTGTHFIEPYADNYHAFLNLLRNHQTFLPEGANLTSDQLVYVAGLLYAYSRRDYSIGGMRITDPTDLCMPEVLEHIYGNRAEAELAGGYLLVSMGSLTAQERTSRFNRDRVNFYDIIGKACYQVARTATKNAGHKMMMNSIFQEYRLIRRELNRFARELNSRNHTLRPT